jgi:hypothetical protein
MFSIEIKNALIKMNVVERYLKLSQDYSIDSDDMFENYDIEKVLKIFNDLGYDAKYNKAEQFFKIITKIGKLKFQINISLKYGVSEIIWCAWQEKDLLIGTPLGRIVKLISGDTKNIKLPSFKDYDDLKLLLNDSLIMYGEFVELVTEAYSQS